MRPWIKGDAWYLHLWQRFGPLVEAHKWEGDANGARGHQNNPVAIFAQIASGFNDQREVRKPRLVGFLIHNRAGPCMEKLLEIENHKHAN